MDRERRGVGVSGSANQGVLPLSATYWALNSVHGDECAPACLVVWCAPQVPPTMRFVLDGEMPPYLLAKDLILQVGRGLCACVVEGLRGA